MQQEWLIKHILQRMGNTPNAPVAGDGKYLSLEEAEGIVAETIDYVGQQNNDVEYKYLTGHRKRLVYSLSLIPCAASDDASCLDVGCYGYMAIWAWKYLGYKHVEGIEWWPDIDDSIVERQIQLNEDCVTLTSYNFDLSRSDWPIEKTFDTVLFFEVLEHVNHDPMGIMINIRRRMTADSTLVMSVPNAVSYKTLREFLTGMPPWTYWFFHPDLSHESRHCFEYTPLVFKVLLFSSGFEENVFTTIFAYSDIENESDIIKISESLSLNTETFGDTMIAQAKKTPFGPPIRYPDVLYNAEDYYQSTYPTLYPILETRVRSFIETRGQCLQHAKRVSFLETELQKLGEQLDQFQQAIVENDTLRAQIDELLFICDCYLQKQTKQTQDLRSAQEQAAKAALDLDQAQRESEALVAKLNEIRTSTSWILTSPLRALLGHFPKASLLAGRLLRWGWWTLTFQLPKKLRERQVVRAEKIGHGLRR